MSDRVTKIEIDRDVKEIIEDVREFKESLYFSDVNNFIEFVFIFIYKARNSKFNTLLNI